MVGGPRAASRRPEAKRAEIALAVNALFVAGYLVAWTAAGVLGYAIFDGLRSLDLGLLAWEDAGRHVAGAVIVGAALYQLTTPKDACLRHCRSPAMLLRRWRPGRLGALRMGIEHGACCVGCCWALMAALFALGVMSIAWMAFVAGADRRRAPAALEGARSARASRPCSWCSASRSRSRPSRFPASRSPARPAWRCRR